MIISKLKFFIQKRFMPIAKIRWEIKSTRWGLRKKKYVNGDPIDLHG